MSSITLPRPTERVAIVSLVLVFLCGAVAGAVVMSLSGHANLHGSAPASNGFFMSVTEWKQQLDLSDEQTRRLTSILDDFSHYYENVLADGNSRIMEILTPDQKRRFDQMIRRHKKE